MRRVVRSLFVLMVYTSLSIFSGSVQGGWETTSRCSTFRFLDVWCHSETEAWCVGGDREMLRWNGFSWDPVDYGTSRDLNAIWGFGPDDVYAAGESILHYDGQSWNECAAMGDTIQDIWGLDSNHVIATGGSAVHRGSNSAGWSTYFSPDLPALYDIWGSASDNLYILATQGRYLHFDGVNWTKHQTSFAYSLMGIWGFAADDIFIVGNDSSDYSSLVLHYDGVAWTRMSTPTDAFLYHVWGPAPDNVFAVGGYSYGSEILHYDGISWTSVVENDLFFKFFGVHGTETGNLFAVGDDLAHRVSYPQKAMNIEFQISECIFSPGKTFSLDLNCRNYLDVPTGPCQVIIALEVAGEFYFYPSWSTGFNSAPSLIPDHVSGIEVMSDFIWPDTGSTRMSDLRFWAVTMDNTMTEMVSNLAVVTWAFGPS